MKTYQLPLQKNSLIEKALPRIDYQDTFALETDYPIPVEKLPVLFFKSFPKWFMLLMGIREVFGKIVGLKTAHGKNVKKQLQEFKGEVGESIALFQVLGRTEEELIMGENDSHLDFRLSFFSRPKNEKTEIIITTTVLFNKWMGRAYFFPVKPIHRIIVPILLRRMCQNWERQGQRLALS